MLAARAALNPMAPYIVIRAEIDERGESLSWPRRTESAKTCERRSGNLSLASADRRWTGSVSDRHTNGRHPIRFTAQQRIHKIQLPRALYVLLSPARTAGILAPLFRVDSPVP